MGIPETSIKLGLTSMSSAKWIVAAEPSQLTLVDLANGAQVTRRPMKAEAAIMNPEANVLALRSSTTIQLFNLDTKQKVKSHQLAAVPRFWRWVNAKTIVIVTDTNVMHWDYETQDAPTVMFDRHANLASSQIINYQVSADGNWCLIGGIAPGEAGKVNGNMQLYSVEKKVSQVLQGHAGAFTTIKIAGREDAQLLVFHDRKHGQAENKIFIMEVGRKEGAPMRLPPAAMPVPPEAANDFPVSLTHDPQSDVAFLLSKMGFLYMIDVHTGKFLYRARIGSETVFTTCASGGTVYGITVRTGKVFRFQLNSQAVVPFIVNTLRDNQFAISIAGRLNLPGAENLYTQEFERIISTGDVVAAAKLVASGGNSLRTPATIQRFQQIPAEPGKPQPGK